MLERLGAEVTPEQLLELKICDPAMGSGAFLVEACRQLADRLVGAWRRTGKMPELPRDEDPVLHARRLIAQKCIYGVDKNRLAVDLARLSMWLVTFAREHPFTFVDHSLRHGDSLVGLSSEQIYNLSFDPAKGHKLADQARNTLMNAVRRAEQLRLDLQAIGDPPDNERLSALWIQAKRGARDRADRRGFDGGVLFQAGVGQGAEEGARGLGGEGAGVARGRAVRRGAAGDGSGAQENLPPFHWGRSSRRCSVRRRRSREDSTAWWETRLSWRA